MNATQYTSASSAPMVGMPSGYAEFCRLRDERKPAGIGQEFTDLKHTEREAFDIAIDAALSGDSLDQQGLIPSPIGYIAGPALDLLRHDKTIMVPMYGKDVFNQIGQPVYAATPPADALLNDILKIVHADRLALGDRLQRIASRIHHFHSVTAAEWKGGVQTVTMTGHQLREALEFINPDGEDDREQLDNDLTFGVVRHADDNGVEAIGLCCWNDDTDGVLPLHDLPEEEAAAEQVQQ